MLLTTQGVFSVSATDSIHSTHIYVRTDVCIYEFYKRQNLFLVMCVFPATAWDFFSLYAWFVYFFLMHKTSKYAYIFIKYIYMHPYIYMYINMCIM